jgi:hypothetical protein
MIDVFFLRNVGLTCELKLIIFLFCTALELSTSRLKYKHPTKRSNVDGCVKINMTCHLNHIYHRIIVTSLMIISHHLLKKNLKIKWG